MSQLTIAFAQFNSTVGDIDNNSNKIIKLAQQARDQMKADVIVFHELAIPGYPPEDLLYHQDFYNQIQQALQRIMNETQGIDVIVGYAEATGKVENPLTKTRFNSIAWIRDNKIIANYHKQCLPNYSVFDERRYFHPGSGSMVVDLKEKKIGLLICEDIWHREPINQVKEAGAELLIVPNASPFAIGKRETRREMLSKHAKQHQLPIVYVNQVGGHDELLFDGGSIILDRHGDICHSLPQYEEGLAALTIDKAGNILKQRNLPKPLSSDAELYQALVLGTRDYVHKSGFQSALVGLSGGIDSALTLAIATDALGKENVTAVFMPSDYTAEISKSGAMEEVEALGVNYYTLPIHNLFNQYLSTLDEVFAGTDTDTSEENLQARTRGTLLMAIANKRRQIVLVTGNKSEFAVGYATLYGDMAGGFAVLKDLYKTQVYQMARYRNTLSAVIPQSVIDRPPSAELAPGQKDEDTLPPYDILDAILKQYVEENGSIESIIANGFDADVVRQVIAMVIHSEYKRRQAPPGTRVSNKAFGRDWRYPITSRYQPR